MAHQTYYVDKSFDDQTVEGSSDIYVPETCDFLRFDRNSFEGDLTIGDRIKRIEFKMCLIMKDIIIDTEADIDIAFDAYTKRHFYGTVKTTRKQNVTETIF